MSYLNFSALAICLKDLLSLRSYDLQDPGLGFQALVLALRWQIKYVCMYVGLDYITGLMTRHTQCRQQKLLEKEISIQLHPTPNMC